MGRRADIRTFLAADSTISGLVGQRIYAMRVPSRETNSDFILFAITSSQEGHDLDGAGGWDLRGVKVMCSSQTFTTAESIADAVRSLLKGYHGAMGSSAAFSVTLENEIDDFELARDGSDIGEYIIIQDYLIQFKEP